MNRQTLIISVILLLALAPTSYLCMKGAIYFSALEGQEVSASYRVFAKEIESNSLSNEEIAARVNKIADGEEKISNGFGLLKLSLYFWLVGILAITALQAYLLRMLLSQKK